MYCTIDLHTHHKRCGHASGSLADYVHAAKANGVSTLGFSDHAPLFAHPDDHPSPKIQMARSDFGRYLNEATALQQEHAHELEVLVGIEADYLPGTEQVYRDALADSRVDYVIGSVHDFGPYHVYAPRRWADASDPLEIYERYFEAVQSSARSGLFDVIAHPDAIKAMGPPIDTDLTPLIEETVQVIAAQDVAVEINTSGLRKCGETFPAPWVIRALHELGVPLTYGSDAHTPQQVAHGRHHVTRLLEEIGVETLVKFRRRQRVPVSLQATEEQALCG